MKEIRFCKSPVEMGAFRVQSHGSLVITKSVRFKYPYVQIYNRGGVVDVKTRIRYTWICPVCGKEIVTLSKAKTLFEANHHLSWYHGVEEKVSPYEIKVVRE